jgi:tripartite-type tricarboxylate transporter receptor subunit TctC
MRRRDFVALAGAVAAWPRAVRAQSWPVQVVRIICPIAAGGGIDATARILAAQLSQIWGQQVVVENKTGAAGNIAAEYVARSPPDGYTIYIAAFPHAANPYLYASLGYDPVADFAPVTLIGLYPLVMGGAELLTRALGAGVHRLCEDQEAELCVIEPWNVAASRRRAFSAQSRH